LILQRFLPFQGLPALHQLFPFLHLPLPKQHRGRVLLRLGGVQKRGVTSPQPRKQRRVVATDGPYQFNHRPTLFVVQHFVQIKLHQTFVVVWHDLLTLLLLLRIFTTFASLLVGT